jgi:competence protein ComFC
MAELKPMRIPGVWKQGFALDYHTISSTYLGDDEFGHHIYDTKRTELGELLYRLKYKSDDSVLEELINVIEGFLKTWEPPIDLIIPVPFSQLPRVNQPVLIIAQEIGKRLKVPVKPECITKVKQIPQLRNAYDFDERLRLLNGAFQVDSSSTRERKILLFDDLYRSGATMNAITEALYDEGYAKDVYALAITSTQSRK